MGVSPVGGSDGGGVITGGRDVLLPPPEHSRAFHCDQAHHGPVSSGVAASGVKFVQAVVGTGWIVIGRDVDGNLGVKTDGGG